MSSPRVVSVAASSPAERSGLRPGDKIITIAGELPRDVIRWRILTDEPDFDLLVDRAGDRIEITIDKQAGEPLGAEFHAALFDRVQTCDNHCEFCFVHQLPAGMRRSLYLKDDDYRLSFLYGNYTTLTRFTELDFERVVTERLSPLNVSIHSTEPDLRADILHNRRGAVSLRWLRLLLDHGIEIHGQIVVCPGVNDADALEETLCGILERFPELRTVCVVPLGVSRFSKRPRMRAHTPAEAVEVVEVVENWQSVFRETLGRHVVFAADEYYLMADRPFPPADAYEGFPMHEDGVGMARTLQIEFDAPAVAAPTRPRPGFFASVDGAPPDGYRAPRTAAESSAAGCANKLLSPAAQTSAAVTPLFGQATPCHQRDAPVGVLTGTLGARVVGPLVARSERDDARVIAVPNRFFGGNIGVTGLMVGEDVAAVLESEPEGHRYLLPDVCLSRGVFLDDVAPKDLPRPVEIVSTDGAALRRALQR